MAKQTVDNLDSGLLARTKINENFTELDTGAKSLYAHGAVIDGVTDDSVAIEAWLNYGITNNVALLLPAGILKQNSAISIALTGEQKLSIIGPGAGLSEWRMDTAGNGLNITCAGNWWLSDSVEGNNTLSFSGIDFSTNNGVAGVGINITGSAIAGRPAIGSKFNDCTFRGHSGAAQFWATAVEITDMQNAIFGQCSFYLDSSTRTSDGVSFVGTSAVESPTSYHFTDCEFFYGDVSISSGDYVEGLYVANSSFVAGNIGISAKPVGSESGLQVVNCHFNTRNFSIELENFYDFEITGNLFFSSVKNVNQGSINGIKIGRFNITGNTFVAAATNLEYGVVVVESPDTDALGGGLISENSFYKYSIASSAPIWLGALSRRVQVGQQFYSGDCVDRVLDGAATLNLVNKRTHSGSIVKTLAGGALFEVVTIAIPANVFLNKPDAVIVQGTQGNSINGAYDWNTATATSVDVRLYRLDGVNFDNLAYRLSYIMEGE